MCLAKFAVNYKPIHAPCESDDTCDVLTDVGDNDDENVDEIEVGSHQSEIITLRNNLGEMQK